ncbi:MAG: preprotein translocase subunit SecY [Acidobacteriota bacterium]|nr:preprotein translocase subunit SecY [Acidobacteriota bacterium]MDQ7088437.1 preprotein translocase subunit SecY [Acidobacteriota bacterium]
MIESLQNIFRIPDLRKRVLFTLGMLGVYRIGAFIPIPGIDLQALESWFQANQGGVFGLVDMFTGGNFSNLTIFALGIMPYISASIILQLLAVVWPYLERLQKEGEAGRQKITQWTRYGTVLLSIIQAVGICVWVTKIDATGDPIVPNPGPTFWLLTIITLTTGTAFIMWIGEQITERGIGNGISLIIFAGIVAGLPGGTRAMVQELLRGERSIIVAVLLLLVMVAVVAAVVFIERAQRRIPIQYASRVRGRRMMRGTATFLPLKVNTGGVIPVIFASSLLALPQTLITALYQRFPNPVFGMLNRQLNYNMPLWDLLYIVLIVLFCFFYTSIIFNPMDTADNMKRVGGFIPGVRPGKQTANYIDTVLTRLTFAGAIYLSAISLLPIFLISGIPLHLLEPAAIGEFFERMVPGFVLNGMNVKFYFGGTSLLIVVGVAMDTVQQIESQLVMRHYDGFLKGTRLRGRR